MFWHVLTCFLATTVGDVPVVELHEQSGSFDSVRWNGMELIATANGNRKTLIAPASKRSIEGNTVYYRTTESSSDVAVTVEPVEDGIDLHIAIDGNGHEDIKVFMGQFGFQGQARMLKPIYAGSYADVVFPREQGYRYHYPGDFPPSAFSPVYAIWDSQHTVGYFALAEIGEEYEMQVWESTNTTPGVLMMFSLVGGAEPGVHKEFDLHIRFADGPERWRKVLQPYQAHQALRDGPVRYERVGPIVFYNLRNSEKYDYYGSYDFEPGTTWEEALGRHWDRWLTERDNGELILGSTGVWAQQEQLAPSLEFNPDALQLEASLEGSLADVVARVRSEYENVRLMAMSRPGRKVVNGTVVERDLSDPAEWDAALAQLQGLADLGFDSTYADQLGIQKGWEWVDLVEASPIHVISEWSWDRMITRASCVNVHPNFPDKDAGLLIPFLTPGGELHVRTFDSRDELFGQGIVTPWRQWVADHNREHFNRMASYIEVGEAIAGADNDPDDNVGRLQLMWDGIGDASVGPQPVRDAGENPDQPDDPGDLVTLIVKPGAKQGENGLINTQKVIRLIRGKSSLTIDEVQQMLAEGARRVVVNRRRSIIPPSSGGGNDQDGGGGNDGADGGDDGGDGGTSN